jgi:hypothetical protein
MSTGTVDNIAPTGLILPRSDGEDQQVSGAIWVSGSTLHFTPYGSKGVQKVTSTGA